MLNNLALRNAKENFILIREYQEVFIVGILNIYLIIRLIIKISSKVAVNSNR